MASRNIQTKKVFKKPYADVFRAMTKVLDGNQFYIADAEMNRKLIKAHTNIRLFSWGEDMEITFRGGEKVLVNLNFQNCKSFIRKLFLKREAEKIFKEVEKNLN